MIRFYDKEVFCVEYGSLDRSELRSFFLQGNEGEAVCVLKEGNYVGYITWPSLLGSDDIYESIQEESVVLDEKVWEKGRRYFSSHTTVFGEAVQLPVLNKKGELVCFAWQDEEADRELRMLRELEECEGALTFCDLNQGYSGATIHGFNEIAYYMAGYLKRLGITVNVEGELWKEFGAWENQEMMAHKNYEIWAEGVWQKSGDVRYERLRSVSPEFECVDDVYEANIKAGYITNVGGNVDWLLGKLGEEKEIVIIGTGAESQDAYDWLFGKGIEACAFLSKDRVEKERKLFEKPIFEKTEAAQRFSKAVFIECSEKHSAWGFGEVDRYDYEGYRRNDRYFLLRDYIEVEEEGLQHVLQGKNILFVGDADLCSRVWRWRKQSREGVAKAGYWDILGEDEAEAAKRKMAAVKKEEAGDYDIIALVTPEYDSIEGVSRKASERRSKYVEALEAQGIYDYTDYFSFTSRLTRLAIKEEMYIREELRPSGIIIGAITAHSGNTLVRQSLAGHPQIMMIEEYGFFNENLFSICVRLAEKESSDIMHGFWQLYKNEAKEEAWKQGFPNKEKFIKKMEELLKCGNQFASQELFIMFHIAYEAMYGREISDMKDIMIYWEPHMWRSKVLRKWSYWLSSSGLKGFILSVVRNSYVRAGSALNDCIGNVPSWGIMLFSEMLEKRMVCPGWEERVIRFEDLKKEPRETMTDLCEWLHIAFDEVLMRTTVHGKTAFYRDITGFDLRPVYNLYEKYFTSFDRMRIGLLHSCFQKKYGYPYVNPLDFSRRELQEMFLKEFLWEKIPQAVVGKDEEGVWRIQQVIRERLWRMRFMEVEDDTIL